MKTIVFANNKGGVAKTTTTASIGCALAKMGNRVLLIDLDSQANLTSLISNIPVEEHMEDVYDLLVGDVFPVEQVRENLDLIPSGLSLAHYEANTVSDPMRVYKLQDVLKTVEDKYDFVLIDCPPALGTITNVALVAADFLVLVTTPSELSYQGMLMVGNLMKKVQENPRLNPNIQLLGILVTRFRSNRVANAYVKKIEKESNGLFIPPLIKEEAVVEKSVVAGQNILDFAPDSKTALAYTDIAKTLLYRIEKM